MASNGFKIIKPSNVINFSIGVTVIYFAYPLLIQYDFSSFMAIEVNFLLVLLAVCSYIFSHFLRVIRLHILLDLENISNWQLLRTHLISNTVNILLPFKLGEFVRIYLISNRHTNIMKSFYTVVIERVFDLTCMIILGAILLFFLGNGQVILGTIFGILFLLTLLGLSALLIGKFIFDKLYRISICSASLKDNAKKIRLYGSISLLLTRFVETVKKNIYLISILTFWVWVCEITTFIFFLDLFVEYNDFFILVFSSFLGALTPAGPASLGSQQIWVATALNDIPNLLALVLFYQIVILGAVGVIPGIIGFLYELSRGKSIER